MNNPVDYAKIGIITFFAVFVINKILNAVGMSNFSTKVG